MAVAAAPARGAERSLADFFREFTDEWVRGNPNQATATRYFSGAEQAAMERFVHPTLRNWNGIAIGVMRPTEALMPRGT